MVLRAGTGLDHCNSTCSEWHRPSVCTHEIACYSLLIQFQWPIVIMDSICRNAHTQAAVEWYRKLNQYSIPHLVCLTHGDRLYAECADEEQSERDTAYAKKAIKKQVEVGI